MDTGSSHPSVDSPAIANADASSTTTAAASATTSSGEKEQFLKHLNKLSHKISKPSSSSFFRRPPPPSLDSSLHLPPAPPPPPPPPGPPLQQQPPVYNINKSDFRDVVQKLTGSPAHERIQPPPAIQAPKPPSSRLQRIRPPPLIQLTNRPPPMVNCAIPPPIPTNPIGGGGLMRPVAPPLSPLPPLPTCHAAAESPISAYMRFLRSCSSSVSAVDSDPKWQMMNPPASSFDSPLPLGCLPSPKSPNLLLSPTGAGPLGLPMSPTVPGVPSPK